MGFSAKKTHVGIDIGHHTMQAAQVDLTSSGWKVTKLASFTTPPDCVRDGVIVDIPAVATAIKDMLREAKISASQAHIAAAGSTVFVRPVSFPKMTDAILKKSIRYEAARFIPGSIEESFISYEVLGSSAEGGLDVLLVAAPKDVVESRVAACSSAGLEVETVDIEAFALYRALVEIEGGSAEPVTLAIIDIGSSSTCVSIIDNGIFAMNRLIPQGGKVLTEALASYFHLSPEDAEAGKAQLDLRELLNPCQPTENPPLRVIQSHVDDLIREIRRSLNYFQSQQGEGAQPKKVDRILLSGGAAQLPGLAVYAANKLSLPASEVGVFDHSAVTRDSSSENRGLDSAIAVGLAMRPYGPSAIKKSFGSSEKPAKQAKPTKAPKAAKTSSEDKPTKPKPPKKSKLKPKMEPSPEEPTVEEAA